MDDQVWWRPGKTEWQEYQYRVDLSKTVRILPSEETEGFFLAKIRKSDSRV